MAAGGAHSRFVAWAKVVLPLAGLGLFATLFLVARQIDPDAAIPFADIDVEQFAREARIGAPEFSGVTLDGTVVALTAEVARPDPDTPGRMTAERLEARFDLPDGSRVAAVADRGAVDGATQLVDLTGGVEITTSTGYRAVSEGFRASLAETSLVSDGPVTADGPAGRIEAGAMQVTQGGAGRGTYLLLFNGGVKLIYEPSD